MKTFTNPNFHFSLFSVDGISPGKNIFKLNKVTLQYFLWSSLFNCDKYTSTSIWFYHLLNSYLFIFFLRNRQHALSTCFACLCNWESSLLWTDAETLNQCFDFLNGKATVCWYLVHCQMCTYSHLMLILAYTN